MINKDNITKGTGEEIIEDLLLKSKKEAQSTITGIKAELVASSRERNYARSTGQELFEEHPNAKIKDPMGKGGEDKSPRSKY